MNVFLWINLLAAAVIFFHCVCRISMKRWKIESPELWADAFLCAGAIGVFCHGMMHGAVHHPTEIVINVGMAAYFLSQSWRRYSNRRFKF